MTDLERSRSARRLCQVCDSIDLCEVHGFAELPRITSDCRTFAAGGQLFVCLDCGGVQKLPDATWLQEIEGIYAQYAAYYQSGGDEQIVFDRISGKPRRRSDVILERLAGVTQFQELGHALDVGCGSGVTLTSMSAFLPGWSLSGYEIGD